MKNKYYYATGQILAQDDVDSSERYFYLHDRLGSVRQVVDCNAVTVATYTYNPYGEDFTSECDEDIYNPFKFTGQWYDAEIAQYYLRARQYDPQLMRFTGRDPVKGKYGKPLTLHRYLYCGNEPISNIDPEGRYIGSIIGLAAGLAIGQGFQNTEIAMKAKIYSVVISTLTGMIFDVYGGRLMIEKFRGSDLFDIIKGIYERIGDPNITAPEDGIDIIEDDDEVEGG